MKEVALLVPICSYNNPQGKLNDQHFVKIFLDTLLTQKYDYKIRIYVGYNNDDPIYSNVDHRESIQNRINEIENIHISWKEFGEEIKGKPTWIWNALARHAIVNGYEYMYACGDDISFPKDSGWIGRMIKKLKSTNNIGIAGGDSGNPNLPLTQFMIHKNHYDLFSWIFPPMIHNWFCDNWIQEVYPKAYVHYIPDIKVLNCGGDPRYVPKDDRKLCGILIRRYRPTIIHRLSLIEP
mgnify:FL=1|tara:strand:- start:1702 stop:2412 length:711 start_codon:yes stop_codon:yes gene_type:complete